MRPSRAGLVVLAVAVAVVAVGTAGGTGSYDVSIAGSVATPPESVTVEERTFRIARSGRVPEGGAIRVSVTASVRERYQINLYDSDKNVVAFRNANGSTSVTFDTAGLAPGTYVVGAVVDGPQAIQPVVVTGTRVSVDAPASVEETDPLVVRAELDPIGSPPPTSGVEAVVWNEARRTRVTMSKVDADTYRASIDGLAVGDYRVIVGVEGTDTIEDEKELVGLSDPQGVTVTEATTPTPTPTTTTTTWPPFTSTTTTPGSTTAGPTSSTTASTANATSTTTRSTVSPGTSSAAVSTSPATEGPATDPSTVGGPTTSGTTPTSASPSTDDAGPITPRDAVTTTASGGGGAPLGAGLLALALLAGLAVLVLGRA